MAARRVRILSGRRAMKRVGGHLRASFARALVAVIVVVIGSISPSAPAASEYECGAGGKPNKASKRCDCPAGKTELTTRDVSRCVAVAPKPAVTTAPKGTSMSKAGATVAAP